MDKVKDETRHIDKKEQQIQTQSEQKQSKPKLERVLSNVSDWATYKMKIEQLEQEVRILKSNPPLAENMVIHKEFNASLISASKNLSQYVITEDGIS